MQAAELSVVLVVGQRRERAARALASLLAQRPLPRLEVLLLDCAPGEPPPVPGSDHPAVKRVALPATTGFAAAKTLGVELSTAPVVAFLEEHCRVAPGWAAALIEAHRGPWAAVAGEVHNGNGSSWISRIVALMNYQPWLPPAARAEHDMLPGNNASFKRQLLLGYRDRLETLLRAEIVLHTRLRRDGHRLLLEPEAKFEHLNDSSVRSCARGFFLFHRCYGPTRAEVFGWSPARRALYVAATPAVPLYFVARLLYQLARRRPRLIGTALAAIPVMLALQLAGAAGQAAGLLFGIGHAEARFTHYELNQFRKLEPAGS
jgi:Glycosyl transferase family 2